MYAEEVTLDPSFISHKKIRLRTQHPRIAHEIQEKLGLHPVSARVLAAREFRVGDLLDNFLKPSLKAGLPHPGKLKGIAKACEIISQAVEKDLRVAVCCDFDVDGLTGGSQVGHFLQAIGLKCHTFVPDRFRDGYGLNIEMVEEAAKKKCGVVIAIDFGTTSDHELLRARELGMKTIVIDHHHVSHGGPPADAFVNPAQSGCGFADKILSASGLSWYFLVALRQEIPRASKLDPREYLDLACLGTICDMVPLIGANRVIAKRGLELLGSTKRVGLNALKRVMGVKEVLGCSHVSFGIGPRLNAAGRMVHGDLVIELLTTTDSHRANTIARKLNDLNTKRQDVEQLVKERAVRQLAELGSLPAGIVVWDARFHTGVIGIVAQRLVEMFHRPSIVMGFDKGVYKGSVRGIRGFSVVEALGALEEHLIKFGGHEGAGGFSIEESRLEDFNEAFVAECATRLSGVELDPIVTADTEATLPELDLKLVEEFRLFQPFGMGNPHPVTLIRGLKVVEVRVLKNAHLKAILTDGKRYLTGMMWRQTSHPQLHPGAKVRIACKPDCNTFQGVTEIQGILQAVEGER